MKIFVNTFLLLVILLMFTCNPKKQYEQQSVIYIETPTKVDLPLQKVVSYGYIKVLTNEPVGVTKIPGTDGYLNSNMTWTKGLPETQFPKYETFVYTSKILELSDTSDEIKFRMMDDFINSISMKDMLFDGRQVFGEIMDRKFVIFNSYKEASESNFSNRQEF